jgi:6-phosphogluconolactonase (cycloisomerase 2 family)
MKQRTGWGTVALCAGIALGAPAAPAAAKKKALPNRVFVQTNSTAGNAVQIFNRRKNGKLSKGKAYPTGSTGSGSLRAATPFPFTESQGSVTLSRNGRFLFVTNHGGNAVTSFRVTQKGLTRVSTVPSGGVGPLSVTVNPSNKLIYVVNEGSPANIAGFKVSSKGVLSPLSNSIRPLAYPAGAPAEILFTDNGRVLAVSDRDAGPGEAQDFIETFKVGNGGRATALPPTPATGQTPLGFAFGAHNLLVVTYPDNDRPNLGSAGTYRTASNGTLTPVDLKATGQTATCWVVITRNHKYAFMSNTLSVSLSAYRIGSGGGLKSVHNNPPARVQGAPVELALSRDSKFLYAANVDPGVIVNDPNAKTDIEMYKVSTTGKLTSIGTAGSGMPTSTSGNAAW